MKLLAIALFLFASTAHAFDILVTYSWDSNPAADQVTQYLCEYQLNSAAFIPCSAPIVPPANSITESIIGVAAGDTLTMHVQACNVVGCSLFSPGVSATVPPNLVPSVPGNEQILPMVIQ